MSDTIVFTLPAGLPKAQVINIISSAAGYEEKEIKDNTYNTSQSAISSAGGASELLTLEKIDHVEVTGILDGEGEDVRIITYTHLVDNPVTKEQFALGAMATKFAEIFTEYQTVYLKQQAPDLGVTAS